LLPFVRSVGLLNGNTGRLVPLGNRLFGLKNTAADNGMSLFTYNPRGGVVASVQIGAVNPFLDSSYAVVRSLDGSGAALVLPDGTVVFASLAAGAPEGYAAYPEGAAAGGVSHRLLPHLFFCSECNLHMLCI
jgi:hypothetical protein